MSMGYLPLGFKESERRGLARGKSSAQRARWERGRPARESRLHPTIPGRGIQQVRGGSRFSNFACILRASRPRCQYGDYVIPIFSWIFSSEMPFVSGMTRITQISWPTQHTA